MSYGSFGIVSRLRTGSRVLAFILVAAMGTTTAAHASKEAAIVVDANTGKTLYASNADAARFPASLTKMMTLYMVFEAMTAGRISEKTKVPFSRHAAARPPTKLGVRAGGSITVDQAIRALVTRSANDAAAAVAELLGGSEANFAKMMTAKARALGMNSTTFRNASGLPDSQQRTTARDMAILGMSLREHYPRHYHYFSTRSFQFGKTRIGNHNRLLGNVRGVDGIKTGYIRASGFNLVSSVVDGNRKVVAVVMGGVSGASRDARMRQLIKANLPKASTRGGSNPLVAARRIEPGQVIAAAAAPIPAPMARPERAIEGARPADVAVIPPVSRPEIAEERENTVDPVLTASIPRGGWVVQVGSVGTEAEARVLLQRTASRAERLLADASPFTERFVKDGTTYIRARFGGFSSQNNATRTCAQLKRQGIDCYAAQQ